MPGGRQPFAAGLDLFLSVVVLVLAIRTFVVLPARVPTASMAPTLVPGSWILIDRCGLNFCRPKAGDCVVLEVAAMGIRVEQGPEARDFLVKRLAGMPGDRVRLRDDRQLEINGVAAGRVSEAFARLEALRGRGGVWEFRGFLNQVQVGVLGGPAGVAPRFPNGDAVMDVGIGCVVVLGDNSLGSLDSRTWGEIPIRALVGKVWCR